MAVNSCFGQVSSLRTASRWTWPHHLLVCDAATAGAVRDELPRHLMAHLATHGYLSNSVNDLSTSILTGESYRRVHAGDAPFVVLREAQAYLRKLTLDRAEVDLACMKVEQAGALGSQAASETLEQWRVEHAARETVVEVGGLRTARRRSIAANAWSHIDTRKEKAMHDTHGNSANGSTGKRALIIGVDKYPKLTERYQLKGCVNDAELMRSTLLNNFGFAQADMIVLKDEQANRDSILDALDDLVASTDTDDIVVIHYSGHGSQVLNPRTTDPDNYDETIVPSDSGRAPAENRDITDKEIYARLVKLGERTRNITCIFDSCHSGTITRDLSGAPERRVPADDRPLPAREDVTSGGAEAEGGEETGRGSREVEEAGPSGWLPLSNSYVLIAGCIDEESSFEHSIIGPTGVTYNGALTYFLIQELTKATPGMTYRDVYEAAAAKITSQYPRQHPQLEGARDREIFGTRDIEPLHSVPVLSRNVKMVALGAGSAQGMTIGSVWEVYPPGAKQVVAGADKLGSIKIAAVSALESSGSIEQEIQENAIVQNCRAVEVSHNYGELRVLVDLRADAAAGGNAEIVRQLINESGLLRPAEGGEQSSADLRVYLIALREQVEPEDPVPQLGSLQEPTWAVIGKDGRLVAPARPDSETDVAVIVHTNLERIARYHQALLISNPDPNNEFSGKIDFVLLRQDRNGGWALAEPEADGNIVYEVDDLIAFRITNRTERDVYVNVLDFGISRRIALLYPFAEGAKERLARGKTFEFGTANDLCITLKMPPGFPYASEPGDEAQTTGKEIYKLFVTTQPGDFSFLSQEGVRVVTGAGGARDPLVSLLDAAVNGPSRDTEGEVTSVPTGVQWTTVERAFYLRKGL